MSVRMFIGLEPAERSALMKLAEMELRSPRDQLRVILREELKKRGLLRSTDKRDSDDDLVQGLMVSSDEKQSANYQEHEPMMLIPQVERENEGEP